MEPTGPTDMNWVQFALNNGLAITISLIVIWFAVTYGPKLINAHLSFVNVAEKALDTLPTIDKDRLAKLAMLGDEHSQQMTESQKTNHALDRACNLIDCYANGQANAKEIMAHTSEIRKVLHG